MSILVVIVLHLLVCSENYWPQEWWTCAVAFPSDKRKQSLFRLLHFAVSMAMGGIKSVFAKLTFPRFHRDEARFTKLRFQWLRAAPSLKRGQAPVWNVPGSEVVPHAYSLLCSTCWNSGPLNDPVFIHYGVEGAEHGGGECSLLETTHVRWESDTESI